jgi:citrate lyase subunit beta/citryl-CoA lyase
MSARSYLYVPGHRPEMLAKAASRGADALIIDLEDAVPADRKDEARAAAVSFLEGRDRAGPEVWVRLNGGDLLAADVRAIAPAGPDGVLLPKVSAPEDVANLHVLLGTGDIGVIALIETAAGVLDAPAIARAPNVARLAIGEADLSAELGIVPSEDGHELGPMRAQIVLASAAAGIGPPVGPISTDFSDLDAFRRSTQALKRMGFSGRAAIHPAQVPVVNEVFTPTADEVAAASRLLARYEAAGLGASVDDNGRMIDEAVVRAARRVLENRWD